MLHEVKENHPWITDLRKGDRQCPWLSNGLNCVWKDGHPNTLCHEVSHDQTGLQVHERVWTLPAGIHKIEKPYLAPSIAIRIKMVDELLGSISYIVTGHLRAEETWERVAAILGGLREELNV